MTRKLCKEIDDFIFQFPTPYGTTSDKRKEKLAQEYTAFRIDALAEREKNGFRFKMIGESQSVLQWWMADDTNWPLLQNLAIQMFTVTSSHSYFKVENLLIMIRIKIFVLKRSCYNHP